MRTLALRRGRDLLVVGAAAAAAAARASLRAILAAFGSVNAVHKVFAVLLTLGCFFLYQLTNLSQHVSINNMVRLSGSREAQHDSYEPSHYGRRDDDCLLRREAAA